MSLIIAAEHFTLTPAIKTQIAQSLQKLELLLEPGACVRVFAKREGDHRFSVVVRTAGRAGEWVFEESAEQLYPAIHAVRDKACQVIMRDKRQRIRRRTAGVT